MVELSDTPVALSTVLGIEQHERVAHQALQVVDILVHLDYLSIFLALFNVLEGLLVSFCQLHGWIARV